MSSRRWRLRVRLIQSHPSDATASPLFDDSHWECDYDLNPPGRQTYLPLQPDGNCSGILTVARDGAESWKTFLLFVAAAVLASCKLSTT